ncbi:hypothetical protein N7448_002098 [Penicillium atrosanguineum]|nr:hypothetical protein N7448_002098 [Penicillium atrosanguineum]
MRLHLIISRHGLPATRILWTTASSAEYGTHGAASAAAIASTRTPNIAFANGGYTIAQLLEDVNEVVPLETEPSMFDPEFGGQWGLEDYVVEIAGSECLHFMEVDGLLRDGDEVVIRALQLADLRARRLCGRHQITAEGKHIIDGVAFGSPYLKRGTSSRPAIAIPPRKKRRTIFSSGWDFGPDSTLHYEGANANANADEEGDGEWLPPGETGFGKELSILPADNDISEMGTVIRHHVDHSDGSDSEMDASDPDPEEDDLDTELKALKADFEEPEPQFVDIRNQAHISGGPALRSSLLSKRPSSADKRPNSSGSLVGASSLSSKRSRGDDSSPRVSKAVRFNGGQNVSETVKSTQPKEAIADISDSESSSASSSEYSEPSETSSEEEDSSDEDMQVDEVDNNTALRKVARNVETSPSSSSESDDSSSDSSSEDSSSESESESEDEKISPHAHIPIVNAPGNGSVRTKKSNVRCKLRRRLSKLKEVGVLPASADFNALREWEETHGGWHGGALLPLPDELSVLSTASPKISKKEQEQLEFEARRQKLLRDLASGGVDVDEISEKENVPPQTADANMPEAGAEAVPEEDEAPEEESSKEAPAQRKLDEDEEATRRKLAAQFTKINSRRQTAETQPAEEKEEEESDSDVDWENKLTIKATECIFDDIELTSPPFPFENRWDKEADTLIRQRNGWGKKRKRKQRIQVYHEEDEYPEEEEYEEANYDWPAYEEGMELNYDDERANVENGATDASDLPTLPEDPTSVTDLLESDAKLGAIIAFRQLDMSKETNWQPRMSEYRVAEVHELLGNGTINVRLAERDRRPKAPIDEEDEPREYAGFEMPGFDDEDDDGYRELAFAELSDPKLLRPAPQVIDDDTGDKGAPEGSIVSVVEDSMPNAQGVAPDPADMDLDETTFVTLVTAASQIGSPARSDVPFVQTPGDGRLLRSRGLDADDENSDTPAVPSPSFSGFHSAFSSPGTRLSGRFNRQNEDTNLDGHTLIDEPSAFTLIEEEPSVLDNSNQDYSALSFLSANQSASPYPPQSQQQNRQVVDEPLLGANRSGGTDSLLSVVPPAKSHSGKSTPARSTASSPKPQMTSTPKGPASWESLLGMLRTGNPDQDNTDQDKEDEDLEDHDSLVHSEQSLRLTQPSPPSSSRSSRSSRKPPTSAQRSQSQKPNTELSEVPAASTRSKKPVSSPLPNGSQLSELIDLASPLSGTSKSTRKSKSDVTGLPKPDGDDDLPQSSGRPTRASTDTMQRVEVSVSPTTNKASKKKKKRLSRKF